MTWMRAFLMKLCPMVWAKALLMGEGILPPVWLSSSATCAEVCCLVAVQPHILSGLHLHTGARRTWTSLPRCVSKLSIDLWCAGRGMPSQTRRSNTSRLGYCTPPIIAALCLDKLVDMLHYVALGLSRPRTHHSEGGAWLRIPYTTHLVTSLVSINVTRVEWAVTYHIVRLLHVRFGACSPTSLPQRLVALGRSRPHTRHSEGGAWPRTPYTIHW